MGCPASPASIIAFSAALVVSFIHSTPLYTFILYLFVCLFINPLFCFTAVLCCRFTRYKVPDGKPENKFALDEKCMGRQYAMKVVSECHMAWRNLLGKAEQGDVKSNLSVSRLSDMGSDIELETAAQALEGEEGGGGEGGDAEEDGEYPTSLIA